MLSVLWQYLAATHHTDFAEFAEFACSQGAQSLSQPLLQRTMRGCHRERSMFLSLCPRRDGSRSAAAGLLAAAAGREINHLISENTTDCGNNDTQENLGKVSNHSTLLSVSRCPQTPGIMRTQRGASVRHARNAVDRNALGAKMVG